MTEREQNRFQTVGFEDRREYLGFVKHVWNEFGSQELRFSDVPIQNTLRVSSRVLDRTRRDFNVIVVTEDDVRQAVIELEAYRGQNLLEPEFLQSFQIPHLKRKS